MLVSNFILMAALEIYAALILLSLFLLVYSRNQKKLIRRQQAKLLEILQHNESLQHKSPQELGLVKTYNQHVASQLKETLIRYQASGGTDDIAMRATPERSMTQKILALRYHFLMSESTAITQENDQLVIHWDLLEQHLEKLLPTEESNEQAMELATSKKRIENLEIFKQLFFDMEKQWHEAQKDADAIYGKLGEINGDVDDPTHLKDLFEQYHNVYKGVHNLILTKRQDLDENPAAIYKATQTNRIDPHITNEIIKLRNVAVDQNRIINQLQRKLEEAKTATEKEIVIRDLQQQFQRQARFAQEAEMCVKLLEEELARNHEKMRYQEQLLDRAQIASDENQRIKILLQNFALESKSLMATIIELEQENDHLRQSTNNDADLLKKIQTDFLILQAQYAELEEKYLIIKT